MRWCVGMPPESVMALDNPQPVPVNYNRIMLVALALGAIVIGPLTGAIWWLRWGSAIITAFTHASEDYYNLPMIITLFGLFAAHELMHLMAHPGFGFSRQSIVGYLPEHFALHATYMGVQSRRRLLLTLLMPLLALTVFPYLLAPLLPMVWRSWFAFISVFNALGAAGDISLMALIVWRVPKGAYLQGDYYGTAMSAVPP